MNDTWSKTSDGGATWDLLRQPEDRPRTETGSTDINEWNDAGWFIDAYEPSVPEACQTYQGLPTLVATVALWPEPGDCADLQRTDYQAQIQAQVDEYKPLDDDVEGFQRDQAQRATLKLIELDGTEDADLGSFDPDLSTQELNGEYVADVQVLQIQDRLTVDDQLSAVGDAEAYSTAERNQVETDLANSLDARRQNVRPPTPSGPVREVVRVPDETVDQLLVERFEWTSPEPFPGHFLTATLWSDDATEAAEARLSVFSEGGGSLGVYPFNDNGDGSWTLATQGSEGQRTTDPRLLRYELLWGTGALSVIRRQTLTVAQQGREHKVRYGAPTNGVAASRRRR